MARILVLALLLAPRAEGVAASERGRALCPLWLRGHTFCNIPVFRYALERWPAAPYDVVAFHRGPLSEDQAAALNVLRQAGGNLEVDRVDLAEPVPPKRRALVERLKPEPPCLVALYPGTGTEAWRGPLASDSARTLADSPVRREVSRRILEGQSGVWILLESGDTPADAAAAAVLAKELEGLERTLKLPPHLADDPPLLSDVPVKVAFSVVRLPRGDAAEQALVSMLLKSDTGLNGPVAFPIFGRGRALWALAGAGINPSTISEAAVFLTGACSCEAKEFNPGVDLLFSADWEVGLSAEPSRTRIPDPVLKPRSAEAMPPPPPSSGNSGSALWVALLIVGLLVAVSGRRVLAASKDRAS